jgi:hypothetical protein
LIKINVRTWSRCSSRFDRYVPLGTRGVPPTPAGSTASDDDRLLRVAHLQATVPAEAARQSRRLPTGPTALLFDPWFDVSQPSRRIMPCRSALPNASVGAKPYPRWGLLEYHSRWRVARAP